MALGKKTGGRQKGAVNKRTATVENLLSRFEDPLIGMARIANGDVPCGVCHGKGKTKFQPAHRKKLACSDCGGSGLGPTGILIKGQRVPCPSCDGKGAVDGGADVSGLSERTCQSCYGSGKEKIGPELRGKMLSELAQYKYPKRKAMDVQLTGENGGPMKSHITIEFVRPT
jgi:DnaJ-class molecular chaperone